MNSLNELRNKAYKTACEHGWHDKPVMDRTEHILAELALIHSEVSEASEAVRTGNFFTIQKSAVEVIEESNELFKNTIKDSFQDELADIIIRVLDLCGERKIDIESHVLAKMMYNEGRSYKHGGKLA